MGAANQRESRPRRSRSRAGVMRPSSGRRDMRLRAQPTAAFLSVSLVPCRTRQRPMKLACPRGLFLASVALSIGCGSSAARWPAPSTTHVASATVSVAYCSEDYQGQFGWPDPDKAARVCRCESKGNPRALSRNRLYAGLFQFSRDTWRSLGGGDPFDPWTNSEHAYRLWRRRGFRPWPTCGRR
jgi:hypothetical protein